MGESRHKALFKLMGKPLIGYTLEMLGNLGIGEVIVVQGASGDIEKEIGNGSAYGVKVSYTTQSEARGMGDALNTAKDMIKDRFLVLNPNHYGEEALIAKMLESKARMVLVGHETEQPWLYGVYKFDGGRAYGMIEKPEKGKEPSNVRVVGIYLLPKEFFGYWEKVRGKSHYDYELALDSYLAENSKDPSLAEVIVTDTKMESLKYPWHLFGMFGYLANKVLKGKGVVIGEGAKVDPTAKIEGDVYIGPGSRVFEHAVIKGPAWIGEKCIIGNNALVRGGSDLESACAVGFGTEIKHSILQENTHIHSGFVGDSIIGRKCRLAANFITANRRIDRSTMKIDVKGKIVDSGLDFFGTIFGDGVSTGINTSVMPGSLVGNNVVIWPNAVVRGKIPPQSIVKVSYSQEIVRRE